VQVQRTHVRCDQGLEGAAVAAAGGLEQVGRRSFGSGQSAHLATVTPGSDKDR
jgi:hypothetical protein